jgi:hypothetical protein
MGILREGFEMDHTTIWNKGTTLELGMVGFHHESQTAFVEWYDDQAKLTKAEVDRLIKALQAVKRKFPDDA